MNRYKLWATLVVVAVVLGVIGYVVSSRRSSSVTDGADLEQATARLELIRRALAATESLDVETAEVDWTRLHSQSPEDASIALNRALNRVLLVDELTSRATNSLLDASEKQAARQQLPRAIEDARVAVNDYETAGSDPITALWLRSRVGLHEASLLPATMTRSLRKEIFDSLVVAIESDLGKRPESIVLAGPIVQVLDELEDPINGLPADVEQRAAKAFSILSTEHPNNLFIALRTARLNLATESPRASEAVRRTGQLASAIQPALKRQTEPIGMTPEQLVNEILGGIDEKSWAKADNQMQLWFNVLNSTELVKTDRRRASPHPLDRLSFDSLRRASAVVAASQPVKSDSSPIRFDPVVLSQFASADAHVLLPLDFDLDQRPDLLVASADGKLTLFRNNAPEWELAAELWIDMPITGLLAADLFMVDSSDPQRIQASGVNLGDQADLDRVVSSARHNTFPTLIAYGDQGIRLLAVDGRPATPPEERLTVVERETGLEDVRSVTAAIVGDLDGDGDLDLVVATAESGLRVFVNRGNRTFFEAIAPSDESTLSAQQSIVAMAIVDLDRDLDLDVVTLSREGQVGLLENLLHLQFRYRDLSEIPPLASANSIAVGDVDGNVSWDIVAASDESIVVAYSQTAAANAWTVEKVETLNQPGSALVLADLNNDLWINTLRSSKNSSSIARLGGDADAVETLPIALGDKALVTADFNGDGLLDVAGIKDSTPIVAINTTKTDNHYLAVRFRGIDDNNANSGRVNHYAVGSVLEMWVGPYYRSQVITSPATHFGLGSYSDSASLRVIFPNGLTQTIPSPSIDTLLEEEQTLKGSCPYLYAWDGEKFEFVTDCLWAAPLGLQVAAGVVAKDRPWEYLKVDGSFVQPSDGHYELRITEELWEVAYFDHVSLIAVDHPQDVDIWTNEKVGPGEIAEPTIFAFDRSAVQSIQHAVDTTGREVTEKLRHIDGDYVQGFDRRIRQGLCPPHWIDLDFGSFLGRQLESGPVDDEPVDDEPVESEQGTAQGRESVYLVLTGWILPTDTSLNIQIDQNPELPEIEYPSLWVPDLNSGDRSAPGAGSDTADRWRKAIPFIGFPGGKTKTIVIDVTAAMNRNDPRFRVRTSAQIYWDAAELVVQNQPAPYRTTELPLVSADLSYRGFSKRLKVNEQSPETYDYAERSTAPKWPPLQGLFTRYGDCLDLLTRWDDSMVVMGSGDELRLRFTVPHNDSMMPDRWRRDFILHCVGWDKDADLNTLSGQSADPLPFRDMLSYPPSQRQAEQLEQTNRKNALHRFRTQQFRTFWTR